MLTNKEKNFISAVVYVHNNENHISAFFDRLVNILEENFEKYEIICVNDHSTDTSIIEIKKLSLNMSGVLTIVNLSFYQGIELAMNAGIDLAIGDFVYEFDNIIMDYPEDMIMKIYRRTLEGYDIVSVGPQSVKRSSSKIFYSIYNKFSKTNYKIQTEIFRIISRRAINRVHAMSKTIPYRKAFYANCGLKADILTYSNKNIKDLRHTQIIKENRKDMAISSIILFTDAAYRFSITLALIMMVVTIVNAAYTIVIFLGNVKPVEGWTTTMLFLSFAFFGMFAISAILIKYLSIIIDLVFRNQRYIVESIEKIN